MIRIGRAVKIEDGDLINTLFALLIYANTVIDMFRMLNKVLLHLGNSFTDLFQTAVYFVLACGVAVLALANKAVLKRISATIWLYLLVVLVSIIANSSIMPLLGSSSLVFVLKIAPAFVLAGMLTDFDGALQAIVKMKWILVAYMLVFLAYERTSDRYYYMHVGYNLLYPTLLLLFSSGKHSFVNKLIAVAAILVVLLFCARGTVLVMVPAIGIFYLLRVLRAKSLGKKIAFVLFIIAACLAILLYFDDILQYLYRAFPDSRTLRYIMEGEVMDSSGRDRFFGSGIREVLDNPLSFKGIYGDRIFYARQYNVANPQGYFAHNVILEFLLQYGIVFGGFAAIAFVMVVIYGALAGLRYNTNASVSFVCAIVVPFFLLSMSTVSYLDTFETAVMLGLCLAFGRSIKQKRTAGKT